jgi:lipopolysaccharide transport system ATP-binding protein
MEPAIKVDNLSKRYRLGTNRGSYRTLREAITDAATASWRGVTRLAGHGGTNGGSLNGHGSAGDFWALKDVSFEIEPGEVVGIIGRNGAGKSTLLKILSRITEPTSGRAEFRGRIGSLLEVGTGFHPELTGRENVYLYGAILGMSRGEIARKFDEIVAFSEIERFLDSPVKRYSSGMYVRLAFAVAAHLEPDILLVDEVLSVGDYAFQVKSLGHMERLRSQGTTIVFVSHNMQTVATMCSRCYVLSQGRGVFSGEKPEGVENRYKVSNHTATSRRGAVIGRGIDDRVILGGAKIERLQLINERGVPVDVLNSGEHVTCEMGVKFLEDADNPIPACFIKTHHGMMIYDVNTTFQNLKTGLYCSNHSYLFQWHLECNLLPGRYHLGTDLSRGDLTGYYDRLEYGLQFEVVGDGGAQGIADLKGNLSIQEVEVVNQ